MEVLTVRTLKALSEKAIKDGFGDKKILITSDDEGNEYHALWYGFATNSEEIADCKEAGLFHDDFNTEEVVLLG